MILILILNFPGQSQSRVYYMDPRAPYESCLLGHARVPRHSTSAPAKILVNTYAIIPLRIRCLRVCVYFSSYDRLNQRIEKF